MRFYSLKRIFSVAALLMAAPLLCLPAAIQANGMNELGTGANPGTLTAGQSASGTFSFFYTFTGDGDQYYVTTSYSATDTPLALNGSVGAVYVGNTANPAEASVGDDTLNVDILQNFAYTGSSSAPGNESFTLTQAGNAPGSYTEAQLIFDNQSIGVLGPYYGPGSKTYSAGPTTLTNLGNPVNGDLRYTFFFAAGTAVPEPSASGSVALALLLLIGAALWHSGRYPKHPSCL